MLALCFKVKVDHSAFCIVTYSLIQAQAKHILHNFKHYYIYKITYTNPNIQIKICSGKHNKVDFLQVPTKDI